MYSETLVKKLSVSVSGSNIELVTSNTTSLVELKVDSLGIQGIDEPAAFFLKDALVVKELVDVSPSILTQKIAESSSSSFEGYPLQVRHKQDWGQGFILLLPQTAALPGSDAGSDVIKPASSFVIQNCQTSCSVWYPMYRARC